MYTCNKYVTKSASYGTQNIIPRTRAKKLNRDILVYMPWCYLRAPVSTLQHQTEDGVMDLTDVAAKFRAVFLTKFGPKRTAVGLLTAGGLLNKG
jgi:hypothetical protein